MEEFHDKTDLFKTKKEQKKEISKAQKGNSVICERCRLLRHQNKNRAEKPI